MRRIVLGALAAAIAASAWGTDRGAPPVPAQLPKLTAAQIVERNVAARGGLEAWRKVETMVWVGHMESVHAPVPGMRFTMELKRPNKTRLEISALGEKAIRVFDGQRGWKLRADQQGHPQVRPYSFEEVTFAHAAQLIDGQLIDSVAKGNTVTLEALDELEGRKAYRLSVRLATGEVDHIWVDAQTFLEVRYDRPFEGPQGHNSVSVFYRDYKATDGLQIPSIVETASAPNLQPDRMVIERVMLNVPMDDHAFAKPGGREPHAGMVMGDQQHQAPARRIPLNPSGAIPQPYPFRKPAPSAAPVTAPSAAPAPAAEPAPGTAPAPGPASASAPAPTSPPN